MEIPNSNILNKIKVKRVINKREKEKRNRKNLNKNNLNKGKRSKGKRNRRNRNKRKHNKLNLNLKLLIRKLKKMIYLVMIQQPQQLNQSKKPRLRNLHKRKSLLLSQLWYLM